MGILKLSLKKNIAANYVSQIYVASVGIFVLPIYMKYMGAESYGLVGFFTMLQAWFALLDLGLTPTIARETARYHGGVLKGLAYRQLFRALSLIFWGGAIAGGGGLWLLSESIASRWLNISGLEMSDVILVIKIMACIVGLRLIGGLYRGVISGSENMVWLSSFNMVMASLRFFGVLTVMWCYGFTPYVFFIYQLFIAVLEVFFLWLKGSFQLWAINDFDGSIGWSFKPISSVLKFAITVAVSASLGVLATQTDKLVLSGILPIADYGHFTLAVLVSTGIMIITTPVSSALVPRMARLYAEGKYDELRKIYHKSTQMISVFAGSSAITLAFCAEPLLFAWTGDKALAHQAAPILSPYAVGNFFLVLSDFAYHLQYAKGNLRYHLVGNIAKGLVLVPCVVWGSIHYGASGAGYVWLSVNAFFLFFWVTYVHAKIAPGIQWSWLYSCIFLVFFPAFLVACFISFFGFHADSRLQSFLYVCFMGGVTTSCSLLSLRAVRHWLVTRVGILK